MSEPERAEERTGAARSRLGRLWRNPGARVVAAVLAVLVSVVYLPGLIDFALVASNHKPLFSEQTAWLCGVDLWRYRGPTYNLTRYRGTMGTGGGTVTFDFPSITLDGRYNVPSPLDWD